MGVHAEKAACHTGDVPGCVRSEPDRPRELRLTTCPPDAPRMDGHAQTLAMRALLEAFALHEPPNTDPLWEVEVPDLGSHGRFEQHDAHRIPRQPAADVCDHGEVSHVAGDEHRTVEVLPVGLIV